MADPHTVPFTPNSTCPSTLHHGSPVDRFVAQMLPFRVPMDTAPVRPAFGELMLPFIVVMVMEPELVVPLSVMLPLIVPLNVMLPVNDPLTVMLFEQLPLTVMLPVSDSPMVVDERVVQVALTVQLLTLVMLSPSALIVPLRGPAGLNVIATAPAGVSGLGPQSMPEKAPMPPVRSTPPPLAPTLVT